MLMRVEGEMRLLDEERRERGKEDSFFSFSFRLPLPSCGWGDGTDTLNVKGLITLPRHDAESERYITGDRL